MSKSKENLLNIGVIGMGNAGGMMANLASKHGFDAMAINASEKDLTLLDGDITKIPVGDGRGTGKSRDEAKEFFFNRINLVQDPTVVEFIEKHDAIVVASSIGGGFGSGSSLILVDVLTKMTGGEKLVIPAGVIPFDDEGYTAQNHAIEWLKELDAMEASYLLYDNNIFGNIPKQKAHERVNEQFVYDLMVMRGDTLYDTTSGGIDNRDMMTALSIPGRIVTDWIPEIEEAEVINGSLVATIAKHLKEKSAHAELSDDKVIKASALIYSLNEDFDNYKPSLKKDMQEIFGAHLNDYDNLADITGDEDEIPTNSISIILTGLSAPNLRINRLVSRRDKLEADILGVKKSSSKLSSAKTGNSALQLKSKSFADGGSKSISATDFLKGYVAAKTGGKTESDK